MPLHDVDVRPAARGWLLWLVALYLGLASMEAVRLLWVNPAPPPDSGLFAWEAHRDPGEPARRFRWTGEHAVLRRPVEAPVLEVPLFMSRPDIAARSVTVRLASDDELIDVVEVRENGWQRHAYYLPPIVGSAVAVAPAAPGGAPRSDQGAGWQELQPWRAPQAPLAVMNINVNPTFVPARLTDSSDERELGVGLGELAWRAEPDPQGIGFHSAERDADGTSFRWTSRRWASQPLRAESGAATLAVRADHPNIGGRPVMVALFWNERRIETIELAGPGWHPLTLRLDAAPGDRGVLSIHADRTWRPSSFGSSDARRLGVAVTEIAWR